jgi:hypothetical protein
MLISIGKLRFLFFSANSANTAGRLSKQHPNGRIPNARIILQIDESVKQDLVDSSTMPML